MITRADIHNLLMRNDRAVERAILAIHNRQTQDEQASHTTRYSNGIGFRANHASKGSYYAKWLLQGKHLSPWHLSQARTIALHYTKQLTEIANSKKSNPIMHLDPIEFSKTIAAQDPFQKTVGVGFLKV